MTKDEEIAELRDRVAKLERAVLHLYKLAEWHEGDATANFGEPARWLWEAGNALGVEP